MGARGRTRATLAMLGLAAVVALVCLYLASAGPDTGYEGPISPGATPEADGTAPDVERREAAGGATLEGDGVLRGRLVRGHRHEPVPGKVVVTAGDGSTAMTDVGADGAFELADLPVGVPLELTATSPGLLPAKYPDLEIRPERPLDLGDVVLGTGRTVTVRVRDRSASPIPRARVTLARWVSISGGANWIERSLSAANPRTPEAEARTGEDGAVEFGVVPPGAWLVVAAAEGFATESVYANVQDDRALDPIRLVLRSACALAGTVFDPEGRPAAGVFVRAAGPSDRWLAAAGPAECETTEAGEYRLEGLGEGPCFVSVRIGSEAVVGVGSIRVPAVDRFDIHLDSGATVEGVVLDGEGGPPVAGAVVTANARTGPGELSYAGRRTTGDDGKFRLERIPAGSNLRLEAEKQGFLPWPDGEVDRQSAWQRIGGGETLEREVRLHRGAALVGKVFGPSKEPVSRARVHIWLLSKSGQFSQRDSEATSADGAYRIEDLERGAKGLLTVEGAGYTQPGYPAEPWAALNSGNPPEAWSVEIPEEGEATKDLVLSKGGSVRGTATLDDGGPAAGFSVVLTRADVENYGGPRSSAIVADDGSFRVDGVPPGESFVVRVSGPGGHTGSSEPFRVEDGEDRAGLRVMVKAGATIAGVVRRADGREARGSFLRLAQGAFDPNQPWDFAWHERSATVQPVGAGGAFEIEGLAAGKYTLLAAAPDAAPVRVGVEVEAGEVKRGVEVLLPEGMTIRGTVVNEEGRAVAEARVSVQPLESRRMAMALGQQAPAADAITDRDGAFTVGGLPAGTVQVTVSAGGYVTAVANAKAGASDVTVKLSRGEAIAGVVVDETSGKPVEGIPVSATPTVMRAASPYRDSSARTGEDGAFRIEGLAPGKYTVTAGQRWGNAETEHSSRQVSDVETGTTDLRITLSRGLSISGRFADEKGEAVPGRRWVSATGRGADGKPDHTRQRGAQTNTDGTFVIDGLAAGLWDLSVSSMNTGEDYAAARATAVSAGATDVVITLRKGLRIAGRVDDENGKPFKGPGWVQLTQSGDASGAATQNRMVQVDAEGKFETEPLEPSTTWDLRLVRGVSGPPASARAVPAGRRDVVLTFEPVGEISGIVLDDAGRPAGEGLTVVAQADAGGGAPSIGSAKTDENGRFTVKKVAGQGFRLYSGGNRTDWQRSYAVGRYDPGATDVVIRLSPGVTIRGRVVSTTGTLPEQLAVAAFAPKGKEGSLGWSKVAEDGTFEIKGLPKGEILLRGWLEGRQVELGTARAPSTDVTVTLPE